MEALQQIANQIVEAMQQQLVDNKSYRTGTLYNSINASVNNNTITFEMAYYGAYVNDGHKTRLGTSKNPNYKPSPLHTLAFVEPKPFIQPAIDKVLEENATKIVEAQLDILF